MPKEVPWENGYVESFNGKLRDELLNRELFLSMEEARWVIDRWQLDYNHRRIQVVDEAAERGEQDAPGLEQERYIRRRKSSVSVVDG